MLVLVPVSPSMGKMWLTVLSWATGSRSGVASVARVTWNPCSWLAGSGFDADAGGDAGDDDLGDAEFAEVFGDVGVVEGAHDRCHRGSRSRVRSA